MLLKTRSNSIRALFLAVLFSWSLSVGGPRVSQAQTPSMSRQTGADNEYQLGAILWTQSSAEYRALAYQTFVLARLRLDQDLRNRKRTTKPPAVIVDVDETVLDNSRFQAELLLRGVAYTTEGWKAWCDRAEAGAVPGAVDFLKYAASRGARVFYITNRRQPEKAGTASNLAKLGFPGVTEESVMVREQGTTASKESRREKVRLRYWIAMLVGDNLNDFDDNFSGKSIADRSAEVDRERSEFGSRFIVVPNPMYGDWENAVNNNQSNLTDEQREANRRAALKGITTQP
jgi:5'-nucleotidase (lipoprotein e(P4) family)